MLFHFDELLPNLINQRNHELESSGCSAIYVKNANEHIIAHTEDAAAETLNSFYIVSAHTISEQPYGKFLVKEEKFTSLCYPGHLAGYTMSYNKHGLM
jgi:hypothetical protein